MNDTLRDLALRYAWTFVGTPYRWGGEDPSSLGGMDCSGFVSAVLLGVGLVPYRDTAEGLRQRFAFKPGDVLTPGVLIFWGTVRATHVAFSIGEGLMLEAGGGDSSTTSLARAEAQDAFVRLRPVSSRGELLAVLDPFG